MSAGNVAQTRKPTMYFSMSNTKDPKVVNLSIRNISLEMAMDIISVLNEGKIVALPFENSYENIQVQMHPKTESAYTYENENGIMRYNKIKCIKDFREITGLGLYESKIFTEYSPATIQRHMIPKLEKVGIFVQPV